MRIPRQVLLAGVVLALAGSAFHGVTASAQAVSDGSAGVVCVQGAGGWTDCTLTLSHAIAAGGSIAGSLPAGYGEVMFCDRPDVPHSDGESGALLCGVSGNTAVFDCSAGCAVGSQFVLSALGAPTAATVAQNLRISSSGSAAAIAPPAGAPPALLGDLNGA